MKNPLKEEVLLKGDSKYRSFFTPLIKDCSLCVIGVNMPILKRLAKEYSLEYVKDFYDSDFFELRYLFFASNLLNLKTHEDQFSYIDKYSSFIVTLAINDYLTQYVKKKVYKDDFPLFSSFVKSKNAYLRRVFYIFLRYYLDSRYQFYNYLKDEVDRVSYLALAWLLADIYPIDKEYVFLFLKDKNQLLLKETKNKICSSNKVSLNLKEQMKAYYLSSLG